MTIWTPVQVFGMLVLAGMPRNRCTEFTAIGECESSLDDQAVSPVGAIGVWQIMPATAQGVGIQPSALYNPDVNARAAVLVSGGGGNCAPWDTCYADINRSGRYTFLNWPEPGSCASDHLSGISVVTGTHNSGGGAEPAYPGVQRTILHTVDVLGILAHQAMPGYGRGVRSWTQAAGRLYTG